MSSCPITTPQYYPSWQHEQYTPQLYQTYCPPPTFAHARNEQKYNDTPKAVKASHNENKAINFMATILNEMTPLNDSMKNITKVIITAITTHTKDMERKIDNMERMMNKMNTEIKATKQTIDIKSEETQTKIIDQISNINKMYLENMNTLKKQNKSLQKDTDNSIKKALNTLNQKLEKKLNINKPKKQTKQKQEQWLLIEEMGEIKKKLNQINKEIKKSTKSKPITAPTKTAQTQTLFTINSRQTRETQCDIPSLDPLNQEINKMKILLKEKDKEINVLLNKKDWQLKCAVLKTYRAEINQMKILLKEKDKETNALLNKIDPQLQRALSEQYRDNRLDTSMVKDTSRILFETYSTMGIYQQKWVEEQIMHYYTLKNKDSTINDLSGKLKRSGEQVKELENELGKANQIIYKMENKTT